MKWLLDRLHPVSLSALLVTLVLLFGFQGQQFTDKQVIILLLATVAGVLVEVPVMLSVVWIVNRSKPWYESVLS